MALDLFAYPNGALIPGSKYKVLRPLGAGGMGTVYEVEDTSIEKKYVLKTLNADLSTRPDLVDRMRREAKALARLEHRNIVQVITADTTNDERALTYIVMEKLIGHTLRDVLEAKKRLPVATACRVVIELLAALQHAHQKRIVHRDVKPENIFLHRAPDGATVTKLLDFGIMTDETRATLALTNKNAFLGTLQYASPEQLHGLGASRSSDLYAAGLVLYEAIAGAGPFDHFGSTAKIAAGHANVPPPPLGAHVQVPDALEIIVQRALAKDPEERFPSAYAFAVELEDFRASLGGRVAPAPARTTPITPSAMARAAAHSRSGATARSAPSRDFTPPAARAPTLVMGAGIALFVLSAAFASYYHLVYAERRAPAQGALPAATGGPR